LFLPQKPIVHPKRGRSQFKGGLLKLGEKNEAFWDSRCVDRKEPGKKEFFSKKKKFNQQLLHVESFGGARAAWEEHSLSFEGNGLVAKKKKIEKGPASNDLGTTKKGIKKNLRRSPVPGKWNETSKGGEKDSSKNESESSPVGGATRVGRGK